jgi:Protein of unknown function (DUF3795)
MREKPMTTMMSVCGVLCSECPAFHAKDRGRAHQRCTAEAWGEIYELHEKPKNITCSGCLGADAELFRISLRCKARRCCLAKGFKSCAECGVKQCLLLEKAQSTWDEVPELAEHLSPEDFATYAQPYCGHRERLARARAIINFQDTNAPVRSKN